MQYFCSPRRMSWYADSKRIYTRGEVYSGLESRKNVASSIRLNFASHLVKYFANPLRENIASSLMARLRKLGGSGPSMHAIWLPHHTFFIFINTIFSLFAEFQISKSIYRKICCDYTLVLSMFPPLPHNMHPNTGRFQMSFDILLCLVSKTRWKSYFDHIFVYERPTSLNNHSIRLIDEILNNNRSVKPTIELTNKVFRVFVWRARKGTQLKSLSLLQNRILIIYSAKF